MRDVAASMAVSSDRSGFVKSSGLRIHWQAWGHSEGTPIVLLHGLRGFSGTWRTLAEALNEGYRLVALDQRGRGESDWDPGHNYYTDAYVADLEAVVDQLALQRFALIGHSMGGTTSYVYADRHPDRVAALVIEDIVPGSSIAGPGAKRVVDEMAHMPEAFESRDAARSYWRALRPTIGTEAIEQRLDESLRELPNGTLLWRYDARGISSTRVTPDSARLVDLWPIVDRLQVPTLIIRGERSDFCPKTTVDDIRRRNPRVESVTIEGASHYVHDDAPTAFAENVATFLAQSGWHGLTKRESPRR